MRAGSGIVFIAASITGLGLLGFTQIALPATAFFGISTAIETAQQAAAGFSKMAVLTSSALKLYEEVLKHSTNVNQAEYKFWQHERDNGKNKIDELNQSGLEKILSHGESWKAITEIQKNRASLNLFS